MKQRAYCTAYLGPTCILFFWLNTTHSDDKRHVLELLSSDVYTI